MKADIEGGIAKGETGGIDPHHEDAVQRCRVSGRKIGSETRARRRHQRTRIIPKGIERRFHRAQGLVVRERINPVLDAGLTARLPGDQLLAQAAGCRAVIVDLLLLAHDGLHGRQFERGIDSGRVAFAAQDRCQRVER